jgi:ferredoxin-type protein NapH
MRSGVFERYLRRNEWLLLRRLSQLSILLMFLSGPWFGIWMIKGNLASSELLGVVPLSDPFILLQSLAADHVPETTAILGALIVAVLCALIGGRVYCSWVCPVNMVTDLAHWCRARIAVPFSLTLDRSTRYWLIPMILVTSVVTGTIAWEAVNPITIVQRGLVFGLGMAPLVALAVFLFDLLVAKRGWCGFICPVGAFYGLVGAGGAVAVDAAKPEACTNCGDCFDICPEPQVISPALHDGQEGQGSYINDKDCLNCGRCIDVCAEDVFRFGLHARSRSAARTTS